MMSLMTVEAELVESGLLKIDLGPI